MTLRVVYFAWVREAVGVAEETIVLPYGCVTVGDLAIHLARGHAIFCDRSRLRVAVDQAMAGWDGDIRAASEVAFFPPVTGG